MAERVRRGERGDGRCKILLWSLLLLALSSSRGQCDFCRLRRGNDGRQARHAATATSSRRWCGEGQANYTSAISGPDSVPWTEASCIEFTKLFGGGDPVTNATHLKDVKKGQLIARDCPQLMVKPAATPGGVPSRRVRMTLDGSSLKNITDRSSPTADLATSLKQE